MATSWKGKGRGRRVPGRQDSEDSDEVYVPEEVDGDSVPKDAYHALKGAFDDTKKKYLSLKKEKKKLQEKVKLLAKENRDLQEHLKLSSAIEKENEELKEKVALSFQAFDEKYKESANLRKKLKSIKEEGYKQTEDEGEEQQDLAVQKDETATQTNTNCDLVKEKTETVDSFTQTSEEKTDEVGSVPPSTPTQLLKNCGLEIVLENGKYYLLLTERDALKQWLENETDGKVSVAFEKTPVFERFVQTELLSEVKLQEQEQAIVIQLKNKIVDQANEIKRCRDVLRNLEPKKASTLSVMVQTEVEVHDELFTRKQKELLTREVRSILKPLGVLKLKMLQLQKELDYEKSYCKRLHNIISKSMDVPGKFVLSIENAARSGKSSRAREVKKPPVTRALLCEEQLQEPSNLNSLPDSLYEPPLSLPVQETDRRLRVKISKPKDPDYDPSQDEEASTPVAPGENRSLTIESSASNIPAEEVKTKSNLEVDRISSASRHLMPSTSSGRSISRIEQASGNESDDIEVIDEDETIAAGGNTGTKECPICFRLYSNTSSQQEYEKHVMDHFEDFDNN